MKWKLEPSPLIRRGDKGPERLLALTVDTAAAYQGTLTCRLASESGAKAPVALIDVPVTAAPGTSRQWVAVPVTPGPCRLVARLSGAGTHIIALAPAREWTVYLVHHSHLDVGYTDLQPNVLALHNRVIDDVIRYARATADWPDGARFAWTFEAAYPLARYLEDRPVEDREALLALIRSGRIEVSALLANMHTEACSAEELSRALSVAAGLHRQYGIPVESAMQTDVPGITWQMTQLLASAGVRYLALAPNNYRAPFHKLNAGRVPDPFWWEGPEGSRVLTWFTRDPAHAYQEGNTLGFIADLAQAQEQLADELRKLEGSGYPYNLLHLRIQGEYTDNGPANWRIAAVVREWNETFLWPKLRMATNREFFQAMEAAHGAEIPVLHADWPNWWIDGAGAAPRELAVGRKAQALLPAAEALQMLLKARGRGEFRPDCSDTAWEQLLLWDEHTWGAAGPERDAVAGVYAGRAQWEWKAGYARAAEASACRLMDAALAAWRPPLAAPAVDRAWVAVTNGLAWERSGPVEVSLERLVREGWTEFTLYAGGRPVPCELQQTRNGHIRSIRFVAREVPAMGRKTYELRREAPPAFASLPAGKGATIDNGLVRIAAGKAGLKSVTDLLSGRELAAGNLGRFELHRLQQADERWDLSHWDLTQAETAVECATGLRWQVTEAGPVSASLRAETETAGGSRLVQIATVYAGLPDIHLECRLERRPADGYEALYFAFPFAVPAATVRLQIPGVVMRPGQDQLPGSCTAWYAVQDYVELAGQGWGITWASPDAPLVSVGQVRDAAPARTARLDQPTVYSKVWNNHWQTNFPRTTAQAGEVVLRYVFRSHGGEWDGLASARFGAEQRLPLIGEVLDSPMGTESLLAVDGAMLLAFKAAADGNGYVARIAEAAGKSAQASVRFPGMMVARAEAASVTEEPLEAIPAKDEAVTVPLAPWQIRTLRLTFKEDSPQCASEG